MQLQVKLILGALLLSIVPVGVSSFFIGFNANNIGREGLETQAKNQLVAIREIKKSQIEGYFHTIRNQILTFSNDRMVIEAMRDNKQAFRSFRSEVGTNGDLTTHASASLSAYYTTDFTTEFKKRNAGVDPNAITYLQQLD